MILRSLLLIILLYATACCGFHTHSRNVEESINEETIRRLRAFFADDSPYHIPPQYPRYQERSRSLYPDSPGPRPLYRRQQQYQLSDAIESDEEREIDSIGETVSVAGTSPLVKSQSEIESAPAVNSHVQREIAPLVSQDLPSIDVKQQRAPLLQARSANPEVTEKKPSDIYFIALVAGCSGAAVFGVIAAGLCWYKLQKNVKAAAEADYPTYGVTGPSKEHVASPPSGDRKLAQSAQMYHYQHQKQQMIAIEKAGSDRHVSTSDLDSEEENEEGDYTVYECPGLAPTGEMEVKNPLFQDETTPASPSITAKEPEK